jgi:hypothetical protein
VKLSSAVGGAAVVVALCAAVVTAARAADVGRVAAATDADPDETELPGTTTVVVDEQPAIPAQSTAMNA